MSKSVRQKVIIIIVVIVLALVGYYIFKNFSNEGRARNFVESYMTAVGKGEDLRDYISYSTDGFIDVFEYDYLSTVAKIETEKVIEIDQDLYKILDSDRYDSFDEFKEYYRELYLGEYSEGYELEYEDDDTLIIINTEEFDISYIFLYDVVIANAGGQQVYRKAEITVEESYDDWEITYIYLR